jgi:hypothetical protein
MTNRFTPDGIVLAMIVGFGLTAITLAALAIWLWDKCDRLRRRLNSIEWYLECDSASRHPAKAPPPPPPFMATRNSR